MDWLTNRGFCLYTSHSIGWKRWQVIWFWPCCLEWYWWNIQNIIQIMYSQTIVINVRNFINTAGWSFIYFWCWFTDFMFWTLNNFIFHGINEVSCQMVDHGPSELLFQVYNIPWVGCYWFKVSTGEISVIKNDFFFLSTGFLVDAGTVIQYLHFFANHPDQKREKLSRGPVLSGWGEEGLSLSYRCILGGGERRMRLGMRLGMQDIMLEWAGNADSSKIWDKNSTQGGNFASKFITER